MTLKDRLKEAERPKKYSKTFLTLLGFLLIPVISFADIFTGREFGLGLFYFLPVFMITRSAGTGWGLAAALACAEAWFWTDLQFEPFRYRQWTFIANAAVRLYFFSAVVGILSSLEREKKFARRDFLTGISNRQAFFELAETELSRARRYGRPLSFAYIDCDGFKKINDTRGHHAGNRLLRVLAETLHRNIRGTDIAVRLGGDEFGFLMPETDYEASRLAVARVWKLIDEAMQKNGWPVTVSIGTITCLSAPASVDLLVHLADDLMYEAKNTGKNKMCHEVFRETSEAAEKVRRL